MPPAWIVDDYRLAVIGDRFRNSEFYKTLGSLWVTLGPLLAYDNGIGAILMSLPPYEGDFGVAMGHTGVTLRVLWGP